MKLNNNIIFLIVIILIVTSVYFNTRAIKMIEEVNALNQEEVTGRAPYGSVHICFNSNPYFFAHDCNMQLRARADGTLRDGQYCTVEGRDPENNTLSFTETQIYSSLRQMNATATNLTMSGSVLDNGSRVNNVTVDMRICDESGCGNSCIYEYINFVNIEYRSGVLFIQRYPNNFTNELHIENLYYDDANPIYFYHNSMYEYFRDLDGYNLDFEFVHDSFACLFIDIDFDNQTGQVYYSLNQDFDTSQTGPCEGRFVATNPYNFSNMSNVVEIYIEPVTGQDDPQENPVGQTSGGSQGGSSGGDFGGALESGNIGESRPPKVCIIRDINCSNWTSCEWLPMNSSEILFYARDADGVERRTCTWLTNCPGDMYPAMRRVCDYKPSCNDTMLNCHEIGTFDVCEEDVDCGGPCPFCPNCTDWIHNQNEEGVDCGGACPTCSTCFDKIMNCVKTPEKTFLCEDSIDCGGICAPCANCTDGIKNCHVYQNGTIYCEDGIDCGGPCPLTCPEVEQAMAAARFRLFWLLFIIFMIIATGLVAKPLRDRIFNYLDLLKMKNIKNLILRSREYMTYYNNQVKLLSNEFNEYTAKEAKLEGDRLLFSGETTGYNIDRYSVSFDNDYADILKDNTIITINYAMYLDKVEHGRALLKEMVKHGIKPDYRVCKRTSAVLWDPNWEPDKNASYETVNGKLVARTVEYILSFHASNKDEAKRITRIIGDYVKVAGWDVPDIRITGDADVPNYQKRILNSKKVAGQDLLVLTKEKALEGFKKTSIFINDGLARFIK